MNDAPTLDDFERDVAHALRVKADQLEVEEIPFRRDVVPALAPTHRPTGGVGRVRLRRALVAAATIVVLVGAVAAVRATRDGADSPDVAMAAPDVLRTSMPESGTAALVPAAMPDGWTLSEVDAWSGPAMSAATWQLFGVDRADGTSPLPRGVLVGSTVEEGRVLSGEPTHTVQGQPAAFVRTNNPLVPAEAIELTWADGEVFHDVVAVGLTEAELLDFVELLVPHDDPATGFEVPTDAPLPELDAVDPPPDQYNSWVSYVGPGGATLDVAASSADHWGGLLHRLVGAPRADGVVVYGGDQSYQFGSGARDDGWVVDVSVRPAPVDSALLDGALDSIGPVTRQELVDLAVAEPVTATEVVGDWTVELHGSEHGEVGMCITGAAAETACTTALSSPGLPGLTTGSALVGDEWVVVALRDGTNPARIEATSRPDLVPGERLQGERRQSGDHVVEVLTVPAEVDALFVTIPLGDHQAAAAQYDRPGS